MKYRVTRDVSSMENSNYSGRDVKEGEILYAYDGYTYGCISWQGIALTEVEGQTPFFEFPVDAVEPVMADADAG